MNPYASDSHEHIESIEQQPQGLSGATMLATIIMLVFGLSGLTSIFGTIMSLIQLTATTSAAPVPANAPVSVQSPAQQSPAQQSPAQDDSPQGTTAEDSAPATESAAPSGPAMPPAIAFQFSPFQIGLQLVTGVLDFLLAIPMVLWSIQVLQRKRSAALRLSGLALLMAILEIPRGLFAYFFTPEILNSVKQGMIQGMEQQSNRSQQPSQADLDSIFQVMTYAMVGCTGVILVVIFFTYLFCFFQLRKPTTLARLSG